MSVHISPLWDSDINGRTISVLSAWTVTLSYEANNANNKNAKTILAGESVIVAEYNLYATHEQAKAKGIELTFSDANLKDSVDDIEVYYGDELVASNPTWAAGVAKYTNLNFSLLRSLDSVVATTILMRSSVLFPMCSCLFDFNRIYVYNLYE